MEFGRPDVSPWMLMLAQVNRHFWTKSSRKFLIFLPKVTFFERLLCGVVSNNNNKIIMIKNNKWVLGAPTHLAVVCV